jgi:hypothetical protein
MTDNRKPTCQGRACNEPIRLRTAVATLDGTWLCRRCYVLAAPLMHWPRLTDERT